MEKTEKILKRVDQALMIEIRKGVYLQTSSYMEVDKEAWGDEDPMKDIDFTTSPYWITTDSGEKPIGIDSAKELEEYL